jgi:predicted permease
MRTHPPKVPAWLVAVSAPSERRDAQLGDLQEELEERAEAGRAARAWYWRQALLSFGPNVMYRIRRTLRTRATSQGDGMMETLLQDLRLAVRAIRKSPGFSALVALTLGLGIGANSTIFSAVYGLILDPFPFPEPTRIVGVGTAYPKLNAPLRFFENLSPAEFTDIRDQGTTLEDVVAWDMGNRQIGWEGPPQNVFTAFWWGNALQTVGMDAYLGRGFTEDEVNQGNAVAMLSYRIWRDRFGADSSLVGQTIAVNDVPHTVVGIIPEGVAIYGTDLWTTMAVGPERYERNRRQFQVMARIRDGATLADVNAELEGLARRTERTYGAEFEEYERWSMRASTWNDVNSQLFRTGLFVVMGSVGFVLLLISANTANLLLARAQGRRREMAVRTALGARRGRLVTQVLTESVLLASLGGAVGLGVAWLGATGLQRLLTDFSLPIAGSVEVNGQVLGFTAALALGVGVVFGLAPAVQGSSTHLSEALQAEGRSATPGARRQRLQRALVGIEVALAFVLLTGGGLLLNSFVRMIRVDPGFDPHGVLTMRLTLPRERYSGDAVPAFFRTLSERVEAVPGVAAAGAGTQFPPVSFAYRELWFDGSDADPDGTLPNALATITTAGYFDALGIPLLAGRVFDDRDRADTPLVAIVNQLVVDRYYGGQSPVGQRLKVGGADSDEPWFEIIGVVGTTRNRGLDQPPAPEVYAPHAQIGEIQNQLFLVARTTVDPASVLPAVRQVVAEMDPDQPVYAIRTIDDALAQAASTRRVTTLLLALFGTFALVLAAVGIYSVISYTVSDRTQEIGVRVALGADGGRVRRLVVRQALPPVLIGAAVGLALAVPLGRAMTGMLFQIGALDPITFGSVAAVLVGVAVAASWIPAWRASRMDPVRALRVE